MCLAASKSGLCQWTNAQLDKQKSQRSHPRQTCLEVDPRTSEVAWLGREKAPANARGKQQISKYATKKKKTNTLFRHFVQCCKTTLCPRTKSGCYSRRAAIFVEVNVEKMTILQVWRGGACYEVFDVPEVTLDVKAKQDVPFWRDSQK